MAGSIFSPCFSIFVLILTLFIISFNNNSSAEDVPVSKLSQNVGGPTLKFLYCYSCGYRKMFDQYVSIIQQKYPGMIVDGSNYDPPGVYIFLSRVINIAKMCLIIAILGNINIFEFVNLPRPSWWDWCTQNKLYACLMLFFLCNIIEGQLIQSGAFEISLNDVPVWSKLDTGRIPQPAELFQIIDSHLQFAKNKLEYQTGFAK